MPNIASSHHSVSLECRLACNEFEVRRAQRLRYEIFGEEMKAHLRTAEYGIDFDLYDSYCHHLLVIDRDNREIVGYTRILTEDQAYAAGGFYSQNEFDLSSFLPLPGATMEIGRTCIHPAYRTGRAISALWSGLSEFMLSRRIQYLIGCASVPMPEGPCGRLQLVQAFNIQPDKALSGLVIPRHPLPETTDIHHPSRIPPLLKAYLRLGAKICGAPCWDEEFHVADIFILVEQSHISKRYHRHFIERPFSATINPLHKKS